MDDLARAEASAAQAGAAQRALAEGRRPDLDYIRAAAILGVVLYHVGVPGFSAGYVGVDLFFVLSGYLITGLVAEGHYASMGAFYAARVRRLVPAMAVMIVAVVALFLSAGFGSNHGALLTSAAASLLFVNNIRLAALHGLYAGPELAQDPFTHLWTLGVEGQFYLVWPALLFSLPSRREVLAVLGAVAGAASLALCLAAVARDQPLAFFSFPTRAWELMAGAVVALAPVLRSRPVRHAAIAAGCLLAGAAFAFAGPADAYPGATALMPAAGAALILLGLRDATPAPARGPVLSAAAAVGRVSYGWYLWHWPLLVALQRFDPTARWWARLAAEAVALGLAAASYRLLEQRITAGRRRDRAVG
jgi:peptidoglycan/LPS O-acetylase OafA/YrhL